jgi:hypothetical protein
MVGKDGLPILGSWWWEGLEGLEIVALPVSAELEEDVGEEPSDNKKDERWFCIIRHVRSKQCKG